MHGSARYPPQCCRARGRHLPRKRARYGEGRRGEGLLREIEPPERPLQKRRDMGPVKGDGDRRSGGGRLEVVFEHVYRCVLEVEGKTSLGLREWAQRAEAWRIVQVLKECRGNRTAAARALGIGRRTLYNKIDRLALEPAWTARAEPARSAQAAALATAADVDVAS